MENKIEAKNLDLYYGEKHALKNVSLDIKTNKITAFIGPSGCGKSTFLKTLNRMNDYVKDIKITVVWFLMVKIFMIVVLIQRF